MKNIYNLSDSEMKDVIARKDVKVAIVGFGYVGTCLGVLLAESGIDVIGVDTRTDMVNKINSGQSPINEPEIPELIQKFVREKKLTATTDINNAKDCDIILLTVGTPLAEDLTPDITAIISASKELGSVLQRGHVVILKSTTPPGTTEDIVKPLLEKHSGLKEGVDFGLAFCPERFAEGSAMRDLRAIPVVIGGMGKKCSLIVSEFWKSIGLGVEYVGSPKAAEMTKLLDNWWIDLSIALANEIALLSEKVGVDAFEIIRASNTLPKGIGTVNILLPGAGVGGSCLVKDPLFVHHMGKKYGLDLKTPVISREINDKMPHHMYKLTRDMLTELGLQISGSKITVLGLAFKGSTNDVRYTPAKKLIDMLISDGGNVTVFDPWVDEKEARTVTSAPIAHDIETAVKNADCIVVVTDHPEFKKLSLSNIKILANHKFGIVDGRRVFNPAIAKTKDIPYKGVGFGYSRNEGVETQ